AGRQPAGLPVEGQPEMGGRPHERCLHRQGRRGVEGAVMGGEQILGEGQPRRPPRGLPPEIAPHARLVAIAARLKAALPPRRGGPERHRHAPQDTFPQCDAAAKRSMASASLTSRSVTPPASWVASVTSTLL